MVRSVYREVIDIATYMYQRDQKDAEGEVGAMGWELVVVAEPSSVGLVPCERGECSLFYHTKRSGLGNPSSWIQEAGHLQSKTG